MAQPAVYHRMDQPMFGTDDFDGFDQQMLQRGGDLGPTSNGELDRMLSGTSHVTSASLLTPGTMDMINNMWTPSISAPYGPTAYPNEHSGYFDNAMSTASLVPALHPPYLEPPSQPDAGSAMQLGASASSLPVHDTIEVPAKKKRRARKKKVKTEEEEFRNRENFLERNRKAAQKCRQRKKVWMEDIQQKKDAASELMNILGMEVIHLVDEVQRLRKYVEEHKACEHHSACDAPAAPSAPTTNFAKRVSQRDLPSPPKTYDARRRDSQSTEQTVTTDLTSADDMVGQASLDPQWSQFSDPCWRLAMEAQRRFTECNPDFVPSLPNLFRHDDRRGSRAGSVDSGTALSPSSLQSGDDMMVSSDQRTDSGFSELSTPRDHAMPQAGACGVQGDVQRRSHSSAIAMAPPYFSIEHDRSVEPQQHRSYP